jgi:CAAX amino terminal protease family.
MNIYVEAGRLPPTNVLGVNSEIKSGIIVGLSFICYLSIRTFLSGVRTINFNIGIYYWIGGLITGFVEEVPFRGFLFQKLQEYLTFWKANLGQS